MPIAVTVDDLHAAVHAGGGQLDSTALAEDGVAILAVEQNVGLALQHSDAVSIVVEGRVRFATDKVGSLDLPTIFAMFTDMSAVEISALSSGPSAH